MFFLKELLFSNTTEENPRHSNVTHSLRDYSFTKTHTKQRLHQDRKFEKVVCHFSMTIRGTHRLHQRHSEGLPSYQTILSNTPSPSLADLSVSKQNQRVKMETGQSCTHPYFLEALFKCSLVTSFTRVFSSQVGIKKSS